MAAGTFAFDAGTKPEVDVSTRDETVDATCTVVALRGDLDSAALNTLVETFDDAITRDDADIVVDLAGVKFMGAGWISELVRSRARLEAQDRELTLRSPPQVVRRLLDFCGLTYLIEPIHLVGRVERARDRGYLTVDARSLLAVGEPARQIAPFGISGRQRERVVSTRPRPRRGGRAAVTGRHASRAAGGSPRAHPTLPARRRGAGPRRRRRPRRSRLRGSARTTVDAGIMRTSSR